MKIIIQDTYHQYNQMMTLAAEERRGFYENTLMEPYQEIFKAMHMPMNPETMGLLSLSGQDDEMKKMLDMLNEADAWNTALATLEAAASRFEDAGVPIPEKVVLGIFLGNPATLAKDGGVTGFGGFPGYIQIVIAPNEKSIATMPAIIAHEFHHNVLFKNATWNFMNVSVAKYLAVEGLAESFAASMFGSETLGPWVKRIVGEELERTREIIGEALNIKGFHEVRKYMFGDQLLNFGVTESTGIPPCGGYAVGYHAVQAFLKNTGISIEKATLLEGEEIMEKSGHFKK